MWCAATFSGDHDNSGDQAGSEAKLGVGTRCSKRPEISTENSDGPELPPGSRLPGERDLAAEYGVALGTARRAIVELRSRGLAVTLPAKGTFVVKGGPAD